MPYSVMVVEDEKKILAYLHKKLAAFAELDVLGAFDKPEEALAAFADLKPDAVFLDIEMPRMSGLELAGRLLGMRPDTRVVFMTAYEQYALDAFRVEAIDYVLKPVANEDIERIIQRLRKHGPPPRKAGEPLVRCFGEFVVGDESMEPVKWPTKKAEELFAYFLAYKGQRLSKWTLIELLWPDLPEEKGAQNLHTTVYRIKQEVGKLPFDIAIERDRETYRLLAPDRISDMEELQWLMSDERHIGREHERAAELFLRYRPNLFGDKDYQWSVAHDAAVDRTMKRLGEKLCRYYDQIGNLERSGEILAAMKRRQAEFDSLSSG